MSVKGLNKVLKDLKRFGDEADELVDGYALDTAGEISQLAKNNAPFALGKLRQDISTPIKIEDKNYKIVVLSEYGAYVEFGTGTKVSIPPEMREIASKVKKRKGSFEKGLQSIRDWCKVKGIDEKLAYIIFVSILEKGIQPQPFLYPALVKARTNFVSELKKLLDRLTKKYE